MLEPQTATVTVPCHSVRHVSDDHMISGDGCVRGIVCLSGMHTMMYNSNVTKSSDQSDVNGSNALRAITLPYRVLDVATQ